MRKSIVLIVLIFFTTFTGISQSTIPTTETKKKTIFQFGLTFSSSSNDVNLAQQNDSSPLRMSVSQSGNIGTGGKYMAWPSATMMITPTVTIPLSKKFSIFSGFSYSDFRYYIYNDQLGRVSRNSSQQYHFPLQLSYYLKLGSSRSEFVPKIGVTTSYHKESIIGESGGRSYVTNIAADPATVISYTTTIEEPSVNKIIPNLSASLAFRINFKKMGSIELGFSGIYVLGNPKINYIRNTKEYDYKNYIQGALLSEWDDHGSYQVQNSNLMAYISLYPNFLRITKKITTE